MCILMITDVYFTRINDASTSIKRFREDSIIRVPSSKVIMAPENQMMSRKFIEKLFPGLKQRDFDLLQRLPICMAVIINMNPSHLFSGSGTWESPDL